METLVIHPSSKSELILVRSMLKKMDIKVSVVKEPVSHKLLKEAMLNQSKKFFSEMLD